MVSWMGAYEGQTADVTTMMCFILFFSQQGKLYLQKWYLATLDKDKKKVVLAQKTKMCCFLEWWYLKVVYKSFKKAYLILDEFLMGDEVQDTSKKSVLKAIDQADLLQKEEEKKRLDFI
ncbi:UNVERIFIED_CONTAM: hypothetical protein K2H54_029917 [Gekko kuhli]